MARKSATAVALILASVFIVSFISFTLGDSVSYKPLFLEKRPTLLTIPDSQRRFAQQSLAWNPNNTEYLLVYVDDQAQTIPERTSIKMQRLNSQGVPLAPAANLFAQSASGPNIKQNPYIEYHPVLDEFLVVFEYDSSPAGDESNYDIYGVFVNANATKRGSIFPIFPESNASETRPRIAANTKDSIYPWTVAWKARYADEIIIKMAALGENISPKLVTVQDKGREAGDPFLYFNPNNDDYIMVFTIGDPEDNKGDLYTVRIIPNVDVGLVVGTIRRIYGVIEVNGDTVSHAASVAPILVGSSPITVVWQVNGKSQNYLAAAQLDEDGAPISELADIGTKYKINRRPSASLDFVRNFVNVASEVAASVDSDDNSVDPNIYLTVFEPSTLGVIMQSKISNEESNNNARSPVTVFNGGTLTTIWVNGSDPVPATSSRRIFADDNNQQQQPQHETTIEERAQGFTAPPSTLFSSAVGVQKYIYYDNGDDNHTTLIVLVVICVFFITIICCLGIIILVIVIKYREILRERVAAIRDTGMAALPRGDGFEQL